VKPFHKNIRVQSQNCRQLAFLLSAFFCFLLFCCFQRCSTGNDTPRILVFDKAEGYYHESTNAGIEALRMLCRENKIRIDVTSDGESFTADNLKKYATIVFLNTAGDVLNQMQEEAFEQYIHGGGGFMGIHTAIDTEHNWEWYGKLAGAQFKSQSEVEKVILKVEDRNHPASQFIQDSVIRQDERFVLKNISPDINIILSIDDNSYEKEIIGNFHPVSWYQEFEGGRVFMTSMGHTSESYKEEFFLRHLSGGLKYTIAENKPVSVNKIYSNTDTTITHTTNGFIKTSVICDLNEPMEMDIFPDGRIIFIERGGGIKLFDPASGITKVIGNIEVFTMQEEGLLGIAIDPDWKNNRWIYLYYTPEKDNDAIRLSRFIFNDNSLKLSSEKVILAVPTQKGPDYYHAAGSIEFDANGFLYLSTGDNSSPRGNEYAVIDERRGRIAFDAQKSSSNSMDLRGKILRIKPLPDGSYLCPKGNLFVKQDIVLPPVSQQKNDDPNFLKKIKGTINPEALQNQEPGVAGLAATRQSKASNSSISVTDPVYTSYGRPEIFVMGVRNPFRISYDNKRQILFWGDIGPDAGMFDSLRGPEGYDEINAAHTAGYYGWPYFIGPNFAYRDFDFETKKSGTYFNPEQPVNNSPNNTGSPLLPSARPSLIWYSFKSSKEFPNVANGTRCAMAGPVYYCDQYPTTSRLPDRYDKNLFIYDWMRNWIMAVTLDSVGNYIKMDPFAKNLRLNRPVDMLIDKKGSIWILEYGTEWYTSNKDACLSRIDFTKGDPSLFDESVKPLVQWDFFKSNRSFYQPGSMIPYKLKFADAETEQFVSLNIDIQYNETNQTVHEFKKAYLRNMKAQKKYLHGQVLIDKSDCKSCHALDRAVNGPSYLDISSRYFQTKKADSLLTRKIINGGSGTWGERAMIAHPQLSQKDVNEMVNWILSLSNHSKKIISSEGRYRFKIPDSSANKEGIFTFHSSINEDANETIMFRSTLQQVERADSSSKSLRKYKRMIDGTASIISEMKNMDFFVLKEIDLHGIKSVEFALEASPQKKQTGGGVLELHLNEINGSLLGSIPIPVADSLGDTAIKRMVLPAESRTWPKDNLFHDLFFVVKNGNKGFKPVVGIDWIKFNFE
jgi:cytochrome c